MTYDTDNWPILSSGKLINTRVLHFGYFSNILMKNNFYFFDLIGGHNIPLMYVLGSSY